ncbi:unnamed protein product [Toxocara canis]|uniref:FH2 domain-containing protein n=1 Tax=Toxocara canis TaxID=6265 RepID=A0A183U3R4_TOXCA|nr:unnamed protein product [Toxocara canis]
MMPPHFALTVESRDMATQIEHLLRYSCNSIFLTPKKQDEQVRPATDPSAAGNTKQVQAEVNDVHQAAIKFFSSVPESVIKEVHSVFSNEKSTADEMEAALKKLTVFFVPSEMREKFQDILSQLQSLISLKIKLVSYFSS